MENINNIDITENKTDKRPTLYDISWKVPESVYRADPALNYSLLSAYERNGRFDSFEHLFDKIESSSLTFGSLVDCLLTDPKEDFEKRFMVAQFPEIGDQLINIAKALFDKFGKPVEKGSQEESFGEKFYPDFNNIPDEDLSQVGLDCNYYANKRYDKYRVKMIRENCEQYYVLLLAAGNRQVISQTDYDDAVKCVEALNMSPATASIMSLPDNINYEEFYQLKFKGIGQFTPASKPLEYRVMADKIIVDHKRQIVYPFDFKTSYKPEWDFYKSFKEWRYDLQARLYWRVIRYNMDKNPYYKDFKLADYRFIVVNRKTLTPLVWEFPLTTTTGTIKYKNEWNTTYKLRDPYEIGEELKYYLDHKDIPHHLPIGISEGVNNIMDFLKME